MSDDLPAEPEWRDLVRLAKAEVKATLNSLPAELRDAAGRLPVTYEHYPNRQLIDEGIEPDTLGLFVGPAFAEEEATPSPIPAQIILYLDNLWDMAEADPDIFREEIRTTLLHELGHYLGLDEEDLTDRGLE